MSEPIYYVDRSDIREGKLAEVRSGMRELAAFVAAREAQLIAYNLFLDETESRMTVVAVHPDSASMEFHLEVGGSRFRALGAFIALRSIDVYGEPSAAVVDQLRHKAEMLGGGVLTIHSLQAGFSRLDVPRGGGGL